VHRWFRKCAAQTTGHRSGDAARLRFEQLEDRRLLTVASFQDGVFPTVDYDGTRDAPIFGAQADVNFGVEVILRADNEQSSSNLPVWSLMKWDLSSIPAGATLNDVTLTVNVTNTTVAPGYDLFQVLTPWEESGVTWNNTTAVATWENPGAFNLDDPEDVNLTVLGTLLGTTTGQLTISLNADGEEMVQQWISNPATNHGLLMANPANDNSLRFDSREGITPANRPKLSIDFTFEDLDPPIATLVDPLDGGPADEDADANEVRVGVREVIVIGLDDFQLDDATVTADTLTVTKDAAPFTDFSFAFDAGADEITLTPTADSFSGGIYTITLSGGVSQIADQSGNIMPGVELLVEIDASLPTMPVAEDDTYETDEDVPLIIDAAGGVLDNDFDGNAAAEAIIVTGPANGNVGLNADGSFTYTPAPGVSGPDSFTYFVRTPVFDSNVATVTISVQENSPITTEDSYDATEDELLTVNETNGVLANDDDLQGDEFTAVLVDDVSDGTLVLDSNGSFTYQPDENFFGVDSFTYYATDGVNDSASTLVEIAVENVNDPPVAVNDNYVIGENETLTAAGVPPPGLNLIKWEGNGHYYGLVLEDKNFHQAQSHAATLTFSGMPGHLVSITSETENEFLKANIYSTIPAELQYAIIGLNDVDINGTYQWTTGETFNFSNWNVNEPGNSQASEDAVAAARLGDWAWNDTLTNRVFFSYVVEFDVTHSGVLLNDHDADGDELTPELEQDVQNGTLSLADDGSFTYTPDPGFVGNDTFTYRANDGELDSNLATVKIVVTTVITAPDSYVVDQTQTLTVNGGVANAVSLFVPNHSFESPDIDDGTNANESATGWTDANGFAPGMGDRNSNFPLNYQSQIDPTPDPNDGEQWMWSNHRDHFTTTAVGLQANSTYRLTVDVGDRTDLAFGGATLRLGTGSTFGETLLGANVVANTPPLNGPTATDGWETWISTFTTGPEPVGEGDPIRIELLRNGTQTLFDNVRLEVYGAGVLYNDRSVEGDPLSAVPKDDVNNGTLVLNQDGSFSYTPNPYFVGLDQFTYIASDGVNESVPTTATIEVRPSGPVSGRHVFYNNSSLDGQDPTAGAADDNAIATEKWVLLPGQTISPGKVFAGAQGINGLMIDIVGVGDAVNIGPNDFVVRTGTGEDPSGWDVLEFVDTDRVPLVSVRESDGVGGSDRVTLTWPDGTLTNTYVQVTVLANGRTGLAEPDVFYAASQVGDATGDLRVDAADLARVLANWGTGTLPEQGNFDLTGTTGAADLATLFVGGSQLDDFTAPPIVAPDAAAQAVDAVIVQAISGPEPETDPIVGPVEFSQTITPAQTRSRLLRRIGRSFSHDDQPTDRQRLARQQAVDRVHEAGSLELPDETRIVRRRGGRS